MDISRQTAPQRHFPNREFPKWTISRTDIRVLEIAVRSGRDRLSRVGGSEIEILLVGEFFYRAVGTWREVILTFEPFSKLKTVFCEYWRSFEIKISMTSVSKRYENKTKIIHEQWLQLKMMFSFGYNLKVVIWLSKFLAGGWNSPYLPSSENSGYFPNGQFHK